MKLIQIILDDHGICYTHIKITDQLLIIGSKNSRVQEKNEQNLPGEAFDLSNYYYYKCKLRRQQ